jgi:hypothetical protein
MGKKLININNYLDATAVLPTLTIYDTLVLHIVSATGGGDPMVSGDDDDEGKDAAAGYDGGGQGEGGEIDGGGAETVSYMFFLLIKRRVNDKNIVYSNF